MESTTISAEAKKLSIPERILLVEEVWNSIVEDQEKLPLTNAQREELNERIVDYKSSPQKGCSWDEVKHRITESK
jgi:putative addiction module component (TIGR02574 family)